VGNFSRAPKLSTEQLPFAKTPAVGRVSISSPAVMRSFREMNAGKRYADQVKPFNFVLTCHVNQFGHPTGADPEHFHLIAPYETDPGKWLRNEWIDRYSGQRYRVTTAGDYGERRTARVKTYGEVLEEYEFHPEPKCADSEGNPWFYVYLALEISAACPQQSGHFVLTVENYDMIPIDSAY
jgi:hypothetical protein